MKICVTGDPFKTPEPAALMEQHRASQPAVAANTSLSQLLARREESREQGRSVGEGRDRLKNSREFLSQPPSEGERSACREEYKLCVSEESGAVVGGGDSTAATNSVWHKLVHHMKTTCIKGQCIYTFLPANIDDPVDILHVDDMGLMVQEIIDFNTHLPEFTMKRK